MLKIKNKIHGTGNKKVEIIAFTDDIVTMGKFKKSPVETITTIKKKTAKDCLTVKESNTKFMKYVCTTENAERK